jgi:HD-GYP domain-containing protein (c-di-GMP phosphodiesterase class II)
MVESHCAPVAVGGLLPVPAVTIEYLQEIDFDVYVVGAQGQPVLFCSGKRLPQLAEWAALREHAVSRLFIKAADEERWRTQFGVAVLQLLEQNTIPPLRQYELLQVLLDDTLRTAHNSADAGKAIKQTQQFAPHLVRILRRGMAAGELFQILRHDFDTFSHVVNVASYCVLLARHWGIQAAEELEKIAVGGLLHDFGKREIPRHILMKRGPLTMAERELVEEHPQRGYEALQGREEFEFGQLMMAYQHHERVNGRGYPVQITGQEMHPWARLCAVCDVFEALTSERPYRKAMGLNAALELLQGQAGTHFDREMVQCWMSAIRPMPSINSGAVFRSVRP